MATNLDLQEQEQIDELKAFWKQYGNLITWVLTLVLVGMAAVQGWNWWQRDQATKASAMFDELDRAMQSADADKAGRVFGDLKERFARTTYTQQAGLLVASLQVNKGQTDAAQANLVWLVEHAADDNYQALARLRLAALLIDAKAFDEAAKQIDAIKVAEFAALADDRRGDLLLAQGKKDEAVKAWHSAWVAMSDKLDYRRVIEAKLTAQAAAPEAAKADAKQAAGGAQ
jgi:predicted negative regulator of RcsB-dependent stress response